MQVSKLLEEITERVLPEKPGASLEEIVAALDTQAAGRGRRLPQNRNNID